MYYLALSSDNALLYYMSYFQKNLSHLLETANIQARDIARSNDVSVTVNTIYRILRGDIQPRLDFVCSVSRRFNVSIDVLVNTDMTHESTHSLSDLSHEELIAEIKRQNEIIESYKQNQKTISSILRNMAK